MVLNARMGLRQEILIRELIRESLLIEVDQKNLKTVQAILDSLSIMLGVGDLLALGAAAGTFGAAVPVSALYWKISGIAGGILSLSSAATDLLEEPPDVTSCIIDIVSALVSFTTTAGTGRVTATILKRAEVVNAVSGVIMGAWGLTPKHPKAEEVKKQVAQGIATGLAKPPVPVTNMNDIVLKIVCADITSGLEIPMERDDFIQEFLPFIPQQYKEVDPTIWDKAYTFYVDEHRQFALDPSQSSVCDKLFATTTTSTAPTPGATPGPGPAVGSSTRSKRPRTDIPKKPARIARDYYVNDLGDIMYMYTDAESGVTSPPKIIGNVSTTSVGSTLGTSIPHSKFKFSGAQFDDDGYVKSARLTDSAGATVTVLNEDEWEIMRASKLLPGAAGPDIINAP